MGTLTTIRSLYKPDPGETLWGDEVNANFDDLDETINGIRVEQNGSLVLALALALNFVGATVVDAGSGEATVTITGGSTDIIMTQVFS